MKTVETIAASDLKAGRYRQLIKFIKIYDYTKLVSFFDIGTILFSYKNRTCLF